ncbi:MAG: hypothetical protein AB1486_28055 [Planctomycetota bacterium]
MQVKLLTLRFSERLGTFDTGVLDEFTKDKEIESVRESGRWGREPCASRRELEQ